MKKALLLLTLLASLGLHALTEKQKSIAFMKDWVVIANGKMELHQTNTVTGRTRLLVTAKGGVWTVINKEITLIADNLSFQERAEEFMKDWVTDGLGIMEVYMRNVVTGETRFVKNDGKGVTTIFSIKRKKK
jgi:hypothetical protein